MKKRILSLVLAVSVCLSMFTFGITASSATVDELQATYTERAWDWQENQFDAMTDDQKAVIEYAWTNYEANKASVEAKAEEFVADILDESANTELSKFYGNETMKDFYKWKLMRDLMEGRIDATNDSDEYEAWLADFTAFEEANDESVSLDAPIAALNQLKDYSEDLTQYYVQLAEIKYNQGDFTGDDADKVNAYLNAYDLTEASEDMTAIHDYLAADAKEVLVESFMNNFELGLKIATNKINRDNTTGVVGMVSKRDMKAGFLLIGEDFAREMLDLRTGIRDELASLNKRELANRILGEATDILGPDNAQAAEAIYEAMKKVAEYLMEGNSEKAETLVSRTSDVFGINLQEVNEKAVDTEKAIMEIIDSNHGLELIHLNTYLGREILRYKDGEEYVSLGGATIDANEVDKIMLGFGHNRANYNEWMSKFNEDGIASFDANYDANGFKVYAGDEIGEICIDVDANADGSATIGVYRGYSDSDMDGPLDYAEDVYRYVTSFTVEAHTTTEPDVTTIEDIADFKLSEQDTITIKGTTTLENVIVLIERDGNALYLDVFTKEEYEAGIEVKVPYGAVAGAVYNVSAGAGEATATTSFEILPEDAAGDTTTLEPIASFKLSEKDTFTIKGTTTLEHVIVLIEDADGKEIFNDIITKEEFEAGFEVNVPYGAEAGDVYYVAVGAGEATATTSFEILPEDAEVDTTTLEPIASFKLSEKDTFTIKGATTLEHVIVLVEDAEGHIVFSDIITKEEFEAGLEVNVPYGAEAGDVYYVAVGAGEAVATTSFEILSEDAVNPTLALAGSASRSVTKNKTIVITTTPQNVPAGSVAEVVWTVDDGEIAEITAINGDFDNLATVKGLKKGSTTVTATLYVDGVEADSKTVTVKVTTGGSSTHGTSYDKIVVKVDETVEIATAPESGVEAEFVGTGNGEVKVEIVDGKVVVTGVKPGTLTGSVNVKNENGNVVLSKDVIITVVEGEAVKHECEWPDITAHWAHETIDVMTINGYIAGYEDGTFRPDGNITRAEFSTLVYRILGLEAAEDGVIYEDTEGHWAEDIIATMSLPEGYGMLRGYGDGNFGPNDLITREQAVAIIARAKSAVWKAAEENAKDVFTDAESISWWFAGEMDAAVTNGLITGYNDGSYKPGEFTTRAEACVLLARAWPEILE